MFNDMKRPVGLILLVFISILVAGCNLQSLDVGQLRTESETVELGPAEQVIAEIALGAGKLEIGGGASALMEADFTYNVDEFEPEVTYEVTGGTGRLAVHQPSIENRFPVNPDDIRYEWILRLNEQTPLDLDVSMGAGEGVLELKDLNLGRLDFQGGAGDINIDLSGSTVEDLAVQIGAGNVVIDLSGNWQQDLAADLQGGVGTATILLPSDVGVRARVSGGLGQVTAPGLNKNGELYTNDAYGESAVTLDLDIEGGIGEITLRSAE